jgi:hypothetical protein
VPTASSRTFLRNSAQSRRWARLFPTAMFAVAALTACGSDTTAPPIAASIVLSVPSTETPAGGTLQYTATVKDAGGKTINLTPTWTVVHGGGTINSSGLFTAGDSAGTFANTVVATSGSATASSSVTVDAGLLSSITVSPSTATLHAGGTQQFTAVGKDAHGNVVSIADRTWSIAAAGGTIDTSGLFTAGTTTGTFANTVTATSGSVSGTGSVTVTGGAVATIEITLDTTTLAIGGTHQYIVTGKDANNNLVPVVPAPVWSVVAGGGTIDTTGLFTAGTVSGQFVNTIHVVSGTLSASMTVKIAAGALASIAVAPTTVSLTPGGTQPYTAVGKDAHANVVPITPTWSVAAGGGTIDAGTGLFTAGTTAGTFTNTVTATSGSVSGTASVTVSAGPLVNLTITPSSTTIVVGTNQQFTVAGTDAHNNPVPVVSPTWSVFAGGGTINNNGLFTAGSVVGTYTNTVVVTSGTVAGVATVTVTAGP